MKLENTGKCNREKTIEILLFLLLVFLLLFFTWLNFTKLNDFLDSDIVAEMSYIQKVVESKNVLPPSWCNSQELFISRPWFIPAPIYAVTNNLELSYQLSIAITTVLCLLSFTYFLRQINLSNRNILLADCLFMGLYHDSIIFHYLNAYSVFIIISFLTIGFCYNSKTSSCNRKHFLLKFAGMTALSFYIGLSGPRMLLMLYIPLFALDFLYILRELWNSGRLKCIWAMKYSSILLLANLFGYVVNKKVIAPSIGFQDVSNFYITDISTFLNTIVRQIEIIFSVTGFAGPVKLFSLQGINCIYKMFLLVLFFMALRFLAKEKKQEIGPVLFFLFSLLFVFLYLIITGSTGADRYYIFVDIMIIVVFSLFLQNIREKHILKIGLFSVLVLGMVLNIANVAKEFKMNGNIPQKEVASYLVNNGYQRVVGTYWNSDILKGLSNGKITTLHVATNFTPYYWLTDKDLYLDNNDSQGIVLILTNDEINEYKKQNDANWQLILSAESIKKIDNYNLYYFKTNPFSVPTVPKNHGEKRVYNLSKSCFSKNSNVKISFSENSIEADNNSTQGNMVLWGPYISVDSGSFDIELTYKVRKNSAQGAGTFDVNCKNGLKGVVQLNADGQTAILRNVSFDHDQQVEFRVFVNGNTQVDLESIEIIRK